MFAIVNAYQGSDVQWLGRRLCLSLAERRRKGSVNG